MILEIFLYALMTVTVAQWSQDVSKWYRGFEKHIVASATDIEFIPLNGETDQIKLEDLEWQDEAIMTESISD